MREGQYTRGGGYATYALYDEASAMNESLRVKGDVMQMMPVLALTYVCGYILCVWQTYNDSLKTFSAKLVDLGIPSVRGPDSARATLSYSLIYGSLFSLAVSPLV